MSKSQKYITINDKKIPLIVRNYKKIDKIKIYFNNGMLNISKPRWYSMNRILKSYSDDIYSMYIEIYSLNSNKIKHFATGEKILYKGKEYNIIRENSNINKTCIIFDEENRLLKVLIPNFIKDEEEIREIIIKNIKREFKQSTTIIISQKLEFWSKKMNLEYISFKVNDTSSKYGSCMPKSKRLFFSLRLVMLPDDIIDLIVVHELAHLVYPNHKEDFYNLLKLYINDYDKKDKWLKENSNLIVI